MCFVPTPTDGSPHIAHGMVTVFEVSKAKSNLEPPTDGVTDVTLSDTSITYPAEDVGSQVDLKVTNGGTAPHGFTLVKISEGKTFDEVKAYFDILQRDQAGGRSARARSLFASVFVFV